MTDENDTPSTPRRPGILGDPESTHSGRTDATEPRDVTSDETAFELVGNEIRAEIVRTLGHFDAQHGATAVVPFSDLRSRADTDVVSSQFNYHLQRLVGTYVEKAEGGYRLRPEGKSLYRTIRAGTFTGRGSLGRVGLDQPCYHCDDELELAYDDGMFTVQCYGCETLYDLIMAPPSAIRDGSGLPARVARYNYHVRQAFAQGVCPSCVNPLDTRLVTPAETGFDDVVRRALYVYRSCDYCGNHSYLSLGSVLLHHPSVISFCHERGLDVTETPRWGLEFAATDRHVTVRSTDPWEASLEIALDGETLEVVVDERARVVETSVSESGRT